MSPFSLVPNRLTRLRSLLFVSFLAFSTQSLACVSGEPDAASDVSESGGALRVASLGGRTELVVTVPAGGLHVGPNTLSLDASTWKGAPSAVRIVSVRAIMAAHNHEADPIGLAAEADGATRASMVLFMSGRWELEVRVEGNGEADTASFSLEVP